MNVILKLKVKQDDKDYVVFLVCPESEVDDICNLILEYDCSNEIIKMPLFHMFTDKEIKHSITDFEFKCFTELNKYIVDKNDMDELYKFKYLDKNLKNMFPDKFCDMDEYPPLTVELVKLKVKQDDKIHWIYLKIMDHIEMKNVFDTIFNNINDNEIILLPDRSMITHDVDKIKNSPTSDFKFKFHAELNKYIIEPECFKQCNFKFKLIEPQIMEEHSNLFYNTVDENN